ncbi:MAG: DNA-3-methyladenine glycosylase 2 family protein [Nitrososphaerota archaeon]|jgi:DNA-3-methyladenine glycosylase II|nr:DNA-3-methyladenine glycosylase 2 family protein [Nitrososphaerota archaeon]MDG7046890.1 DNA-3-methyladenine glycosylase 2 family protein [Nitrososphaerota archaeon]
MESGPRFILRSRGPFDLQRSLAIMANFSPEPTAKTNILREAVYIDGKPHILEAKQVKGEPPLIEVSGSEGNVAKIRKIARWILFTDLNLLQFYGMARGNRTLEPIIRELYGVKPLRTASLFEMMIIAITEQQISLSAAYRIRNRLVQRFGERIGDLFVFPSAESLSNASEAELRSCGLSRQKAEYIRGIAQQVSGGSLDAEGLASLTDDQVRDLLMEIRGFGPWSVNYILVRGLGRTDRVPADDLAVRSVVGKYLGGGKRMSGAQVLSSLEPFTPFRGLTAFYLLAYDRLMRFSV